jgi:hypothetical protein
MIFYFILDRVTICPFETDRVISLWKMKPDRVVTLEKVNQNISFELLQNFIWNILCLVKIMSFNIFCTEKNV